MDFISNCILDIKNQDFLTKCEESTYMAFNLFTVITALCGGTSCTSICQTRCILLVSLPILRNSIKLVHVSFIQFFFAHRVYEEQLDITSSVVRYLQLQ